MLSLTDNDIEVDGAHYLTQALQDNPVVVLKFDFLSIQSLF